MVCVQVINMGIKNGSLAQQEAQQGMANLIPIHIKSMEVFDEVDRKISSVEDKVLR